MLHLPSAMSLIPLYMIFKSLAASNRGELTALARRAPLVFYCKKRFHKVAACTQGDFQRQTMFFLNSGYVERHQLKPWLTVCQMKTQPSLMFGRVKNFQKLTFWFWFWFTAHWGLSRPSREENLATEEKVSAAAFLQSQPPAIIVFIGKALRRGRFFPVRDSHTGWKLVRVNFARLWNHPASNGDSNL